MKNFYRLILAIGLLTVLTSSFALPPCQGSNVSKWNNCFGRWTSNTNDVYEGDFNNGTYNGQGTYTAANGDKYVGEWKDGKQNGYVTATYTTGQKYVGEYKEGKRNGYLIATYPNGGKYAGEFKDDVLNGQGTFTFPDGAKYVGEYKGDEKSGQGTFTFPDGAKYIGEFKEDKQSGQGTYLFADGKYFIGEYQDGRPNGKGIDYRPDGSVLQSGVYKNGTLVQARYIDPNSFTRIAKVKSAPSAVEAQRLEIERKAALLEEDRKRIEEEKRQIALERQRIESQKGKQLPPCQGSDDSKWNNCFGTYIWPDGEKYVGDWKDGQQSGQGSYIRANGNRYAGEFLKGKRNGQGTHTWADGDEYAGAWKDGEANGQGTYTWSSGSKHVGEWNGGYKNGLGIEYLADGRISRSGIWAEDKLVTSQYVDPNSFTRIAKGNSAAAAADALRLENERKAAQLEEERRKFEEEKRQAALERQRTESQKAQTQVVPDNRRRLALVIGNDNYSSMPVLNNAVNDAKSMSDALKQANFEVLYYKNLNKRGMEEALYTFAQKLAKDDVGMFYFAGHGVQANSQNFLIPVAENVKKSADVQFEGIDVNRVMAYLRDSKNSLNIVVLDACRSSLPERGGMSRGLTVTEAPQGSIVAYATSPGKAASDGDGGNSPFTKNLIRVMHRKGVKIEDVFKEVRVAVSRETNGEQVPQEVSQLVGDFYFRP